MVEQICPKCGARYSLYAPACPKCGEPSPAPAKKPGCPQAPAPAPKPAKAPAEKAAAPAKPAAPTAPAASEQAPAQACHTITVEQGAACPCKKLAANPLAVIGVVLAVFGIFKLLKK